MDLENRRRQPSAESAEEVRKLRTRLQESERRLQETEQQIDGLETKNESWRQEVKDAAVVSLNCPFHLKGFSPGRNSNWARIFSPAKRA